MNNNAPGVGRSITGMLADLGIKVAILKTDPDFLISDCGACRMQMSHFTKLDAMDPAQILSWSLTPGIANKKQRGK